MKAITFSIGIFLSVLAVGPLSAQELVQKSGDCSGYHKKNCKELPKGFERNGQSKSALFSVGDTSGSELNFVAYKGHDYRIDVCHGEVFQNEIRFRILTTEMEEQDTVKTDTSGFEDRKDTVLSYKKKEVVLYDNKKDDYAKSLEFSNPDNTQHLTIQVKVEKVEGKSTKSQKLKSRDMGCIGVSIGHMPSRNTGFR